MYTLGPGREREGRGSLEHLDAFQQQQHTRTNGAIETSRRSRKMEEESDENEEQEGGTIVPKIKRNQRKIYS